MQQQDEPGPEAGGKKSEIRISKSETNPNYQNTNVQDSSARAFP
jgi:hypothetical protein